MTRTPQIFLALGLFGLSGCDNPAQTVADWFWPSSAAPWEEVDAVYYPDKENLWNYERRRNVGSLADCRTWVRAEAMRFNDPILQRGDYECGVGRLGGAGGVDVYRLSVR